MSQNDVKMTQELLKTPVFSISSDGMTERWYNYLAK